MIEMKPVVVEKHDIEYRDETLLVVLFGIFASDSDARMKLKYYLFERSSTTVNFSIQTLDGKNENCGCWEKEFEYVEYR